MPTGPDLPGEQDWRAERERYRGFMEMSAELVWRIDFDRPIDTSLPEAQQADEILTLGYVADCNDAMAVFIGMERAHQVTGMRLTRLLAPIDANRRAEMLSLIRNGYRVVNYESRHLVNGEERWALRNAHGVVEAGKLIRMWGASRDVTARRQTDQMLRDSENRYRAFIANSSEGIFRIEFPDPIPVSLAPEEIIRRMWIEGRLAECNMALAKMAGYHHPGEMNGRPSREFRLATGQEFEQALLFVRNGFRFSGVERPARKRDGEERHVRYSATGVVENGTLVRIWGTASDVTDRVNLENELRALWAHQADILERERTRIAREIHDELGQQLTALKFEAAAFEAGKRTPARGEMTQHVDAAIHTVRRIATELRPAILDHFGLGAAVEWQCTEFSRRTGIECSSHVEPDLTIAPSLATTAFRILQEALTNAARHSGASHIRISLTRAEGMLELVVEDNGQGMGTPGDARPRAGLGMIGMRERALGAGGMLEIVSHPNEGTRVHARFPLGAPAGAPA